MKKIVIYSVTLFCYVNATAQSQLGVFGGLHGSSALYTIKNVKQPTDFKFGFQLGVNYKIPFENRLTFVPALSYSMMGYKVTFNQPSYPPDLLAKDNDTRMHEIDVDPFANAQERVEQFVALASVQRGRPKKTITAQHIFVLEE